MSTELRLVFMYEATNTPCDSLHSCLSLSDPRTRCILRPSPPRMHVVVYEGCSKPYTAPPKQAVPSKLLQMTSAVSSTNRVVDTRLCKLPDKRWPHVINFLSLFPKNVEKTCDGAVFSTLWDLSGADLRWSRGRPYPLRGKKGRQS